MTGASSTEVTTEVFSITAATHARSAILQWAGRWWWLIGLPPVACMIAAIFNPMWLIAALIWLLMLLPPALMIAYYSYLLHPVAAAMSRPHKVIISPELIRVVFEPEEDNPCRREDIIIELKDIKEMDIASGHFIFKTSGSTSLPRFIIIPITSFRNQTDISTVAGLGQRQSV